MKAILDPQYRALLRESVATVQYYTAGRLGLPTWSQVVFLDPGSPYEDEDFPGALARVRMRGLDLIQSPPSWVAFGIPPDIARIYQAPPRFFIGAYWANVFLEIAQHTQEVLAGLSVEIAGFPYRWIHRVNIPRWKAALENERHTWESKKKKLISDLPQLRKRFLQQVTRTAEEIYSELLRKRKAILPAEEFVERILREAERVFPDAPQIEKELVLVGEFLVLSTTTKLEKEVAYGHLQALGRAEIEDIRRLEQAALQERADLSELLQQEQVRRSRIQALLQDLENLQKPAEELIETVYQETAEILGETLEIYKNEKDGKVLVLRERLSRLLANISSLGNVQRGYFARKVRELTPLLESLEKQEDRDNLSDLLSRLQETLRSFLAVQERGIELLEQMTHELPDGLLPPTEWRSLCLDCGHVWQSRAPIAPPFCPHCHGTNVANREIKT